MEALNRLIQIQIIFPDKSLTCIRLIKYQRRWILTETTKVQQEVPRK